MKFEIKRKPTEYNLKRIGYTLTKEHKGWLIRSVHTGKVYPCKTLREAYEFDLKCWERMRFNNHPNLGIAAIIKD